MGESLKEATCHHCLCFWQTFMLPWLLAAGVGLTFVFNRNSAHTNKAGKVESEQKTNRMKVVALETVSF